MSENNVKRKNSTSANTLRIALLGLFSALILLMSFTPLGYLKTAVFEITFLMIPVAVGAVVLGPRDGALLGGLFGLTSFIQAASGSSYFGFMCFTASPVGAFLMCLVPRILLGLVSGLIFKWLSGKTNEKLACGAACLAAPILNTVLFMSLLLLFFWHSDYIQSLAAGMSILPFVAAFVGLNGVIEAAACFVIGTAVSLALLNVQKKIH